MKLTPEKPAHDGYYWGVQSCYVEILEDRRQRLKERRTSLPPLYEDVSGSAEMVLVWQGVPYTVVSSSENGHLPTLRSGQIADFALWSDMEICTPKEWRKRVEMTERQMKLCEKYNIAPDVIEEWKNPSDSPSASPRKTKE